MTCHFTTLFTCVLDWKSYVVYSNDGTAKSGVGSYAVKSLTIKMENQALFWPSSNNRIQKYSHKTYEDHIGYPASSADSGCQYSSKDIISIVLKISLERLIL